MPENTTFGIFVRKYFPLYATIICCGMLASAPAMARLTGHHPVKLISILQQVYETNPALHVARTRLEETRELYPQARAGWLPTLGAEGNLYATDIKSSNFSSGDGATTKNVTLSIEQHVYRGGRTSAETARARNLIRAGEAMLDQTEQDIFANTSITYLNVLRDREVVRLRMENETILEQEKRAVSERYELGDTTITAVHEAEAYYRQAVSQTVDARQDLAVSEAEFQELTGIMPPLLTHPQMSFAFPSGLEDLISMAEKQNPLILAAQYEQRASQDGAEAVSSELYPQVFAYASYDRQYDPQPGIVDQSETQTIGLKAAIDLYKGGATRSRIREAARTAERKSHELEKTRERVKRDVVSNWQTMLSARAAMESRTAEIRAAETALQGVREEARLGQRTELDVLNAHQDVISGKVQLENARQKEAIAQIMLAASLGLLSPENLGIAQPK